MATNHGKSVIAARSPPRIRTLVSVPQSPGTGNSDVGFGDLSGPGVVVVSIAPPIGGQQTCAPKKKKQHFIVD